MDWKGLRGRIDLARLAADLMGVPPGRRGEGSGGRLWWNCPLHDDRNPSLCVDPGKGSWRCYGCRSSGSAADLVMGVKGLTFGEAVRWLDEWAGGTPPPSRSGRTAASPPKAPERVEAAPSGLPEAEALALVTGAADRLWRPEGAAGLDYLRGRGLADATIRAAGLGWTPGAMIPKRGGGSYRALGVVVPWRDDRGRLALVKIRQPDGRKPKYAEAFRDRSGLFVASPIQSGRPAIVTEGEFDALLVAQETAGRAGVVTLGSASGEIAPGVLGAMLPAPTWLIALDADDAGDRAAGKWQECSDRCVRVRPPGPDAKDWGEVHAGGRNRIAYHLGPYLGAAEPWGSLAGWRWGPAIGDDEAGLDVGRPSSDGTGRG